MSRATPVNPIENAQIRLRVGMRASDPRAIPLSRLDPPFQASELVLIDKLKAEWLKKGLTTDPQETINTYLGLPGSANEFQEVLWNYAVAAYGAAGAAPIDNPLGDLRAKLRLGIEHPNPASLPGVGAQELAMINELNRQWPTRVAGTTADKFLDDFIAANLTPIRDVFFEYANNVAAAATAAAAASAGAMPGGVDPVTGYPDAVRQAYLNKALNPLPEAVAKFNVDEAFNNRLIAGLMGADPASLTPPLHDDEKAVIKAIKAIPPVVPGAMDRDQATKAMTAFFATGGPGGAKFHLDAFNAYVDEALKAPPPAPTPEVEAYIVSLKDRLKLALENPLDPRATVAGASPAELALFKAVADSAPAAPAARIAELQRRARAAGKTVPEYAEQYVTNLMRVKATDIRGIVEDAVAKASGATPPLPGHPPLPPNPISVAAQIRRLGNDYDFKGKVPRTEAETKARLKLGLEGGRSVASPTTEAMQEAAEILVRDGHFAIVQKEQYQMMKDERFGKIQGGKVFLRTDRDTRPARPGFMQTIKYLGLSLLGNYFKRRYAEEGGGVLGAFKLFYKSVAALVLIAAVAAAVFYTLSALALVVSFTIPIIPITIGVVVIAIVLGRWAKSVYDQGLVNAMKNIPPATATAAAGAHIHLDSLQVAIDETVRAIQSLKHDYDSKGVGAHDRKIYEERLAKLKSSDPSEIREGLEGYTNWYNTFKGADSPKITPDDFMEIGHRIDEIRRTRADAGPSPSSSPSPGGGGGAHPASRPSSPGGGYDPGGFGVPTPTTTRMSAEEEDIVSKLI